MKFLNKKERVIDIELTPYGKLILSQGNFKPEFYAFFDDDVIYDKRYAGGTATGQNPEEPQNDIHDRIKEDLQLETQTIFTSREESVRKDASGYKRQVENILNNNPNLQSGQIDLMIPPSSQPDSTKYYDSLEALGTAKPGIKSMSSWAVNSLQGLINTSSYYDEYNLHGKISRLPQIEMDPISYKAVVSDDSRENFKISGSYTTLNFDDGKYIRVFEDSIVLKIEEKNTEFDKENFDIELFEVIDAKNNLQETKTELRRMYFKKQSNQVVNNILVDEEPEPDFISQLDPNFVDYYFQILADDEIDQELLCEIDPDDKKMGIFSERLLECEELEEQRKIQSGDIYTTDVTLEDISDKC
jgi:hypothetical protein